MEDYRQRIHPLQCNMERRSSRRDDLTGCQQPDAICWNTPSRLIRIQVTAPQGASQAEPPVAGRADMQHAVS